VFERWTKEGEGEREWLGGLSSEVRAGRGGKRRAVEGFAAFSTARRRENEATSAGRSVPDVVGFRERRKKCDNAGKRTFNPHQLTITKQTVTGTSDTARYL
jgi:hypothetical protein